METNGRPKRAAAVKKVPIILSDTSDSEHEHEDDIKPNIVPKNKINLDDSYSPDGEPPKNEK